MNKRNLAPVQIDMQQVREVQRMREEIGDIRRQIAEQGYELNPRGYELALR